MDSSSIDFNSVFDKPFKIFYDYKDVTRFDSFFFSFVKLFFLCENFQIKNFNISDTRCVNLEETAEK